MNGAPRSTNPSLRADSRGSGGVDAPQAKVAMGHLACLVLGRDRRSPASVRLGDEIPGGATRTSSTPRYPRCSPTGTRRPRTWRRGGPSTMPCSSACAGRSKESARPGGRRPSLGAGKKRTTSPATESSAGGSPMDDSGSGRCCVLGGCGLATLAYVHPVGDRSADPAGLRGVNPHRSGSVSPPGRARRSPGIDIRRPWEDDHEEARGFGGGRRPDVARPALRAAEGGGRARGGSQPGRTGHPPGVRGVRQGVRRRRRDQDRRSSGPRRASTSATTGTSHSTAGTPSRRHTPSSSPRGPGSPRRRRSRRSASSAVIPPSRRASSPSSRSTARGPRPPADTARSTSARTGRGGSRC